MRQAVMASKRSYPAARAMPGKQKGVVLIVGMIMVLLMTIVGLAAIRGSGLQESMAGNMRDRNLAFQAAEAALREGEQYVFDTDLEALSFNGDDGRHSDLNKSTAPMAPIQNWDKATWTTGSNSREATMTMDYVSEQPRYAVEKVPVSAKEAAKSTGSAVGQGSLDDGGTLEINFYRLTSLGFGGSENSKAIMQVTYRKN